ncbi:protein NLRC5-like, partial [Anneissia japonica]|uniref:protein NLRC5-like n=1 Tax=Anneissia japonica TaxID=1529436 RepID=UPI001425B43B
MTRQKEVYQNVNKITPAIWHKSHEVDIADVFTELSLLQSKKEDKGKQDKSTCTKKEGRPTSLTEALEVIKSTDSCKVLITGEGGMGKTTLLKYIAHQWATDDEHVFADKLLFLINIREIKESKSFLEIIMNEINSKEIIDGNDLSCDSFNPVERFLVKHDNEIIFLLDGYDELGRNAKDPIDLFKKRELRKSMVVITSRPDNTADLIKYCDVHIEVKGFSQSNIKKYIQNYFRSISEIEVGNSLIKEFGLDSEDPFFWGGNHKEAFKLCSSPLLLLHICTIWEEKRVLPTYLPDLFKELICCILNQYLNRAGIKSVIANFERIPDQYMSAILILGECMYIGLKENTLSIDKFVLSNMAKDKELLNLALALGFVYNDTPANPGKVKEMYTPPHKLISEALAGLYLSTEIQKGSLKVEYEEIRCNAYLNMTRMFAIGFLGADADKLLKPWLIIRASNYCSIVQCLKHVKKENEDDILVKLDKLMSNDMKAHSEQMLESFRSLINDGRDISSMHLFKLMKRCSIEYDPYRLEAAAVSLINRCRERQCQLVVHTLVLLQVMKQKHQPYCLLECISKWKNEE